MGIKYTMSYFLCKSSLCCHDKISLFKYYLLYTLLQVDLIILVITFYLIVFLQTKKKNLFV